MDPYKVLQLPKNFTLEQLKRHYKKLVMKYHPDVAINNRLNTPIFQALTESYKTLFDEYNKRQKAPEHHSLKQKFNDSKQHIQMPNPDAMINSSSSKSNKFNLSKFNQLYDKYAYKNDVVESGYGDWLKSEDATVEEKAIINYEEPQPLFAGKFVSSYTELGCDNISDFSNFDSKIQYMDLRKAHTTTKIVDESVVKMPPTFKTLQQIEAHRENIEYIMTNDDQQQYALEREKTKRLEQERMKKIKDTDDQIQSIYEKTHKLMLKSLN